jgi:hypothetical protein
MAVQWNASTFRFATDSENEEINETTTKKNIPNRKKNSKQRQLLFSAAVFFLNGLGDPVFSTVDIVRL